MCGHFDGVVLQGTLLRQLPCSYQPTLGRARAVNLVHLELDCGKGCVCARVCAGWILSGGGGGKLSGSWVAVLRASVSVHPSEVGHPTINGTHARKAPHVCIGSSVHT
jgi:hypothetical protein